MNQSKNIFRIARLKAAAFNDSLASMDSAAPLINMSRGNLQCIETDESKATPLDVAIMSEIYHAPKLRYQYCSGVCPVGKKTMEPFEEQDLDGVTLDALRELQHTQEIVGTLLMTSADHRITPDEREQLMPVIRTMIAIGNAGRQLELLVKEVESCQK